MLNQTKQIWVKVLTDKSYPFIFVDGPLPPPSEEINGNVKKMIEYRYNDEGQQIKVKNCCYQFASHLKEKGKTPIFSSQLKIACIFKPDKPIYFG